MDRETGPYQPWKPELWSAGAYELLSLTDDEEHGLLIRLDHFLAEFHELSLHVLAGIPLVHYFVVTHNDSVDALADIEPKVRQLHRRQSKG